MTTISAVKGKYEFKWDFNINEAICLSRVDSLIIWKGSLLPSFLFLSEKEILSYEDSIVYEVIETAPASWKVFFRIGSSGVGSLCCELKEWGLRIYDLSLKWTVETQILAIHFGTKKIIEEQRRIIPIPHQKFWPDWRADEFCVPCTGSSPTNSFWRNWDKGNAVIPLGSYGPAMGTPYCAAFPRPLYACAMGGKNGWIAVGPGEIPDGALTLRINCASSYLEYLYREDIWGAPDGYNRFWKEPLRMSWGDSAYDAYDALFKSLTVTQPKDHVHVRSFAGTWGAFGKGDFDLRGQADRYAGKQPADVMLIDDYWETFLGSGMANHDLFPDFEKDLEYIREKGMEIGLWQSIGWISSPEAVGLSDEDLLCGADGRPRLSQWLMDPFISKKRLCYCLDPSSPKTQSFLEERTKRLVSLYKPVLLKLDFGYGLPGPDVSAPRDPEFRGEKLCRQLLNIITKAAKAVKPDITIIYYGISPLLHDTFDLLSLDDMGDCGSSPEYEISGHSQRCMWAALTSSQGIPANTSSGYFWKTLDEILLDTAVTGVNGSVLAYRDERANIMSPSQICRWRAIQKWHRRTTLWNPLWLDVNMGGHGSEPSISSWGRKEREDGIYKIFSLSLRGKPESICSFSELEGIEFTGKWAVISQDDKDIYSSHMLAIIPFSTGNIKIARKFTSVQQLRLDGTGEEKKDELVAGEKDNLVLTASEAELNETIGYLIYL